jgi:hypothetical protein
MQNFFYNLKFEVQIIEDSKKHTIKQNTLRLGCGW